MIWRDPSRHERRSTAECQAVSHLANLNRGRCFRVRGITLNPRERAVCPSKPLLHTVAERKRSIHTRAYPMSWRASIA